VRLASVELGGPDQVAAVVAIGRRPLGQARERGVLLLGPGHEQRAGPFDGDPGLRRVGREKRVAARDQARLGRAGLGVEAGVEDRGVGLAGARTDVRAGLDQRNAEAGAPEAAGDGRTHDAGSDDRDVDCVRAGGAGHRTSARVASAARRQFSRRESASSRLARGS
jgi:hypothetical protein